MFSRKKKEVEKQVMILDHAKAIITLNNGAKLTKTFMGYPGIYMAEFGRLNHSGYLDLHAYLYGLNSLFEADDNEFYLVSNIAEIKIEKWHEQVSV